MLRNEHMTREQIIAELKAYYPDGPQKVGKVDGLEDDFGDMLAHVWDLVTGWDDPEFGDATWQKFIDAATETDAATWPKFLDAVSKAI